MRSDNSIRKAAEFTQLAFTQQQPAFQVSIGGTRRNSDDLTDTVIPNANLLLYDCPLDKSTQYKVRCNNNLSTEVW